MQGRESAKASITEHCTTGCAVKCRLSTIAKMSLTSPIGTNVPTRASLAVETNTDISQIQPPFLFAAGERD